MKQGNKGFTLIELLAVIVILAVIALIATPLIMNVINDVKKGAARDAGYNIIKAGEQKAAIEQIDNVNPPYHYDETSNLDLKGTKPTKMTLDINKDMDTQLRAWLNGYCVVKEYENETVTIDENKKSESDCIKFRKYANGEAIYFNPETNTKCSASEYKPDNSLNENKSGCMKWYAFNDSESSSIVNVILDHNTTYKVAWNSTGSNSEMKEVKEALERDTSSWSVSLKPRLIDANEIAKITGNKEFDATVKGKDNYFYFDTNTGSADSNKGPGTSKYKWLFDYTKGCTDWGCNISVDSTTGYWTRTFSLANINGAWSVDRDGNLGNDHVVTAVYLGVRPVITISKSILK